VCLRANACCITRSGTLLPGICSRAHANVGNLGCLVVGNAQTLVAVVPAQKVQRGLRGGGWGWGWGLSTIREWTLGNG